MERREVLIQLNKGDVSIHLPEEKSIMHSALDEGIKLIHSCLQGQCGSCRAYLLEGKVDMRNNFSLFEEEVNEGQVLLCQSFPLSEKVIVKPIRQLKS